MIFDAFTHPSDPKVTVIQPIYCDTWDLCNLLESAGFSFQLVCWDGYENAIYLR